MTSAIHNIGSQSTVRHNPQAHRPATLSNNRSVTRHDGNGFCDFLKSIPTRIGIFFSHAHANIRMYFRALSAMGKETTPQQIGARIDAVKNFRAFIEQYKNNSSAVISQFQTLSSQVQKLFSRVDLNYVMQLRDPVQVETVTQEIIRECDRVVRLQRQLTSVNTFIRTLSGRQSTRTIQAPPAPVQTVPPPAQTPPRVHRPRQEPVRPIPQSETPTVHVAPDPVPEPAPTRQAPIPTRTTPPPIAVNTDDIIEDTHWQDRMNRMFAESDDMLRDILMRRTEPVVTTQIPARTPSAPTRTTTTAPARTTAPASAGTPPAGVNVNLQGTVPYVQNSIPAEIRTKGEQINRLKEQLERLPADRQPQNVPEIYKDNALLEDFMAVPVFDASHPEVQRHLTDRNRRHALDAQSFERQMTMYNTIHNCPICRNPYNRSSMRIDTALQDEMLAYLRRAVAG
jgi:hypothetical protein